MSETFHFPTDAAGPTEAADAALRASLRDLPFTDPGARFDAAVLSALAPRVRPSPWWLPNWSGIRSGALAAACSLVVTLGLVGMGAIPEQPAASSLAGGQTPTVLAGVEQVLDSANVTAATLIRLSAQRRAGEEERPSALDEDRASALEPYAPRMIKPAPHRRSA
jgi:hypothetical protein